MQRLEIACLPGDGIGPKVTNAARRVLEKVGEIYDYEVIFKEGLIGAAAIDKTGEPYPAATAELCKDSYAVLLGAVGNPKYDNDPSAKIRPEQGLLSMRKDLGLYANLRPVSVFDAMADKSPLKSQLVKDVDFLVVRELIGGIYFGKHERTGNKAIDVCEYTTAQIERVLNYAFKAAAARRKKLTVVDKANVLETSRLWRETAQKMSTAHPEIEVDFMFVDNAAMQIVSNPQQFDVIVTENMFGDILTDEASVIAGSLGMLPSASAGKAQAVYEPIHGSYPQAAGKNTANPIGSIMSAAMMLEYSFDAKNEARAISRAVEEVLNAGFGTEDLSPETVLSTTELTNKIIQAIKK